MGKYYEHMSFAERVYLENGIRDGLSLRFLAGRLGRSPSTISRELSRNRLGPRTYRSMNAHRMSRNRAAQPRILPRLTHLPLWKYVVGGLRQKWSPDQIVNALKRDYPDNPKMSVSHETIYRTLYVMPKGELRKEMLLLLRQSRKKRRPRSRGTDRRGTIADMVTIHERPPEVEDRLIPGHWEGDLIVGARHASGIGTLVERSTRYLILVKLDGLDADSVWRAFSKRLRTIPVDLRKSLTYDRGKEMAHHKKLSRSLKIDVYFADPHSPWQRGTNENTNGLLRQYFPKGTDLSSYTQRDLNKVAKEMNGRPRKTLDYMKPFEVISAIVNNQPVALGT